jgi:uncharacterized NAD-dependent epimerase/dehydratase family protein
MTQQEARDYAAQTEKELNIPVVLPLEDGLDRLVPIFEALIKESKK